MASTWATDAFRDEFGRAVDRILGGDVRNGAMSLWSLGLSTGDLGFAGGLWHIWGRITDEYTHSNGDSREGQQLPLAAAGELHNALGDSDLERAFCDRWI